MNTYIINYDLRISRDYTSIIEAIKKYGTYARVLESTWVIKSTSSASQIRDYLIQFLDLDDGVFVAKLTGEAAWRKVLCTNEWLKNNL